ncbi:MAG TPA: tetratricopeptide repeat protein [Tepidisphaeraceae bacterium]|nr:tetratricopeptide repeat protein [Tepidisphaeraceae bacterium]
MADSTKTASQPLWRGAPLVLALLCGIAAYANSLHGPFIFDDIDAILNNPQINRTLPDRTLPDLGRAIPTTLSGRPMLQLSFEADYAMAGLHVEIYHATNLLIHLAAGALLFGIVRRNLARREFWADRFGSSAHWLAGAVTAIWLVHPLNTSAVTYTVQRAESLAAIFYLAVIYCLIRDAEREKIGWKLAAIAACGLGMATKETMATAPIVALLYDRTFISGSFLAALRKRAFLYAGLAATWAILIALIAGGGRSASVGFGRNISAMDYARTQLGVIAHYLLLMIWPRGLALDYYGWPIARHWSQIGIGGVVVAVLIVFFIVMFWLKPWLGFLGAWFFVILGPSSSFVPIVTEIAAEQRMYLPLIAPIALLVIGAWSLLTWKPVGRLILPVAPWALLSLLAALTIRTLIRNHQYRYPEKIWAGNVTERPLDPRARFNLGYSLEQSGDHAAAAVQYAKALELAPDYYSAADALGRALVESGDLRAAENFYTGEMRLFPAFAAEAHRQRGWLRAERGDSAGAREDFDAVTRPSGDSP